MPELPPPSVSGRKNWEWQCRKSAERSDDMSRNVLYGVYGTERKEGLYSVSSFPRIPRAFKANTYKPLRFCKETSKEKR